MSAKRPELAIKMYSDMNNLPMALKIAKAHAPHLVPEIQNNIANKITGSSGEEIFQSA